MIRKRDLQRVGRSFITVAVSAALAECGSDGTGEHGAGSVPPEVERLRAPIAVEEVGTSGPEVDLSYVLSMDIDASGRVFIADALTPAVLVLSAEGELVGSVGRSGKGPGEFESVTRVQILPGDSLLAFDRELHRVTVFSPDLDFAYTAPIALGTDAFRPVDAERLRASDRMLVTYRQAFSNRDDPRAGSPAATPEYQDRRAIRTAGVPGTVFHARRGRTGAHPPPAGACERQAERGRTTARDPPQCAAPPDPRARARRELSAAPFRAPCPEWGSYEPVPLSHCQDDAYEDVAAGVLPHMGQSAYVEA